MAVAAFGNANLIEDPNLFYAVAIVQPPHTTEEVTSALITELDRLKTEPITEHELQRTKNQFARDYIFGRLSNQQKAGQLSHAVVIHGDIKTADGEFDIFQNITVADVQRVARTYFRPENRLVLTLMPSGKAGAQLGCRSRRPASPLPVRAGGARPRSPPVPFGGGAAPAWPSRIGLRVLVAAPPGPRPGHGPPDRPPPPLAAREIKFPPYEIQALPNGLQVVAVVQHEQPAVSMR